MLWEFKNNKNATKTAEKISSVYGECGEWLTTKSEIGFPDFVLARRY